MFEKIKKWWNGEWVSYEFGIGLDRHWTSKVAHSIVRYFIKHQIWIIPTVITVIASVVLARPWKW
ncbi:MULTISPECIES: hypothetical protein [Acinetobacter]|uniref:hypothetical protein n=1 Tax=Acinetobacter TaxID=469 RepID=UPI000BDF1D43|nr:MULTISPECIES: hypothetical protein [Acinetobacter]MCH7380352.1 hypothetical protein [Acinetobacter higginsii]